MAGGMKRDFELQCQFHALLRVHQCAEDRARQIISQALRKAEHPYIAFSTGKDSVVLADLVWEQDRNVPAVYFDADCAFPESKTLLWQYTQVGRPVLCWPCEPFFDTLHRVDGPSSARCEAETMRSTVYRPIKSLLKEYDFDGAFIGLRAEESKQRHNLLSRRGQLFWQKRDALWECLPIGHFTYMDIWAYIIAHKLDYCAMYDKLMELGVSPEDCRLSYWAGETKRRWGRWAILKRGWPELFNRFAAEFPEVRAYV